MAVNGIGKAAMLLLSLDSATATELVKDLAPEDIEKIGIELARLDVAHLGSSEERTKIVQDFVDCLGAGVQPIANIKDFLNSALVGAVGQDKAEEIQSRIRQATESKDPFDRIRQADTGALVTVLDGEHPQTVAVVLAELPTKKCQEVLALLSDEVRRKVVCRLTRDEAIGWAVKQRIASTVSQRLRSIASRGVVEKVGGRKETLRKLALILGGLEKELRDQMLEEIKNHDQEVCSTVRTLMVTWEDIPRIADRSLQEVLRSTDAKKLAVALYGCDAEIVEKIRKNISERAAAALEEESSLMQEPLDKEVQEAREEIVEPLRKANEEDKLRFVRG